MRAAHQADTGFRVGKIEGNGLGLPGQDGTRKHKVLRRPCQYAERVKLGDKAMTPERSEAPVVGLNAQTPQSAAGLINEAVCEPKASGTI